MEARRLLFGGRGGLERLGVGGEVLAAVGGVEAFGENDQRGSGLGRFEDSGAGAGEVGGFVGAWEGGVRKGGGRWWENLPVASCTRASFRGFLSRCAIVVGLCSCGDGFGSLVISTVILVFEI